MRRFTIFLSFFFFCIFCFFCSGCSCGCGCACSKESKVKGKVFRIGIDPYWHAINAKGQESNLLGFTEELLREIAQELNVRFERLLVNGEDLFSFLQENRLDGIISSKEPYNFNQALYDFSEVFLETGPVLLLPLHSSYNSLKELSGKEIALQRESSAIEILQKTPGLIFRTYDSPPAALEDVALGKVDGAVLNLLPANAYLKDLFFQQLKMIRPSLNPQQGLRLIVLKGKDKDFFLLFNRTLHSLKEKGKISALEKKWF